MNDQEIRLEIVRNLSSRSMGPDDVLKEAERIADWVLRGVITEPERDQPLFEVYGQDGHRWAVYENGRCEGFPEGVCVVNHALPLLNALRAPTKRFDPKIAADTFLRRQGLG